jgi:branched-chain amino acid transport system ATP-binding protein
VTLLDVRGLKASYGRTRVLHGVDLSVKEAEIVVILGANGVGKTTTLRALSGMTTNEGEITFMGQDITKARTHRIMSYGIRHVPEGRGTLKQLTVEENLHLGAHVRRDKRQVAEDLEMCLELFPRLRHWLKRKAGALSGGEQQMLAISRALMGRPRLLLLDEPSLGLAPKLLLEVFDSLGEINRERGMTMLVVEQNADVALRVAHRAYVLETGRVVYQGTANSVTKDDTLRSVYLGMS